MPDHPTIAAVYTAAADHFDRLPFWSYFGRATVNRLALPPGARVLDLCCGTGASALPAGEAVGPTGTVLGIDITEALLVQARAKATAAGLGQVTFASTPVEALAFEPASFDAVVSVFGLFFVEDMAALVRRAWLWLRPGGALAITTWGEHVLAPGESLFWEAVLSEDPSLAPRSHAGRLDTALKIGRVFAEAGVPAPHVVAETWEMPLASPDDFWPVILGTSNRAAFEALTPQAQVRVRRAVIDTLRAQSAVSTRLDVLYAHARKP